MYMLSNPALFFGMGAITKAVLYLTSSAVALSAAPVARVISTQPIEVGGITAPARNFVPIATGEAITTHQAPAVVQFRDGSNVVLQPNSELRVEELSSHLVVHVVSGTARYNLGPKSNIQVLNTKGHLVNEAVASALASPAVLNAARPSVGSTPSLAAMLPRTGLTGRVTPGSVTSPASFSSMSSGSMVSRLDPAASATITTATGVVFDVKPMMTRGDVTIYSINSITFQTAGGGTTTVTTGDLIGATITVGKPIGETGNSSLTIIDDGVTLSAQQAHQELQAEAPPNVIVTGAALVGQLSPSAP